MGVRRHQRVALVDGGAEIDMSVTNVSGEDMPGLGLYPYFVLATRTRSKQEPFGW